MGGLLDPSNYAPDPLVEAGDTAVDLAWSGHQHDEIDLLGPSLGNPSDETFEDNVGVNDPETGEYMGHSNTPSAPSGDSAEEEDGQSPGGGSPLKWLIALLVVMYVAGQLFDINLGDG